MGLLIKILGNIFSLFLAEMFKSVIIFQRNTYIYHIFFFSVPMCLFRVHLNHFRNIMHFNLSYACPTRNTGNIFHFWLRLALTFVIVCVISLKVLNVYQVYFYYCRDYIPFRILYLQFIIDSRVL